MFYFYLKGVQCPSCGQVAWRRIKGPANFGGYGIDGQ